MILASVFFLSGLCGLIYEVVWTRMLVLVFGSTTYAISTVLAVFMLGLALGSHIFGKLGGRFKNPQKVYGLLEAGIGAYALIFMPLLQLVQSLHSAAFPFIFENVVLLNIFRIALSFVAIIIPTVLMGATIPLIVSILTRSEGVMGRDVGMVYFLNTVGASLGSFLGAFILIPNLGLNGTLLIGGLMNLGIGAVAMRMVPVPAVGPAASSPSVPGTASGVEHGLALAAFFVTGFLSMVYENAWSRSLIMVFGTSIYAFATMLTTYLFGLALGSLVFSRFVDRVSNHLAWLAAMTAMIGISILATTPAIGIMPEYFASVFSRQDASWGQITLTEFTASFLLMLIPTFCSGASFPIVSRISAGARKFQIGRAVADVYALNTGGCILGSLVTGFLLIPMLGAERSLLLAGAASTLLGAVLLFFSPAVGRLRLRGVRTAMAAALLLVVLLGLWKLPNWDPMTMTSGVYVYSRMIAKTQSSVERFMTRFKLLFYREGPSDTVAVLQSESDGSRFLRVNGKTDGSDGGDKYTQTLLGLLPIMYVHEPRTVLNIGLGTGITSGSLLDYPIDSVECVEISKAVVEASELFSHANGDVLHAGRFHVHILDGRTWLMSMNRQYDIITSEPSHPWQTGNANLFTTEFFEMAKRGLTDKGVLCQWLPYYHMDEEHFRLLLKTVKTVFRFVNVWIANTDALIIASDHPLQLDYGDLGEKMRIGSVRSRFHGIGIDSVEDFLSFFYADNDAVAGFAEKAHYVNSDRFPVIEFNAPKYIVGAVKPDTFFDLMEISYRSRLPLANCKNPAEVHEKRVTERAKYYREWFIPESVSREVIGKALSAYR
jgi:spermidine synthase